jgi:hypothetical protein
VTTFDAALTNRYQQSAYRVFIGASFYQLDHSREKGEMA